MNGPVPRKGLIVNMLPGKPPLSKTALKIGAAALASIALLWGILAVTGLRARDEAVQATQVRNLNLALVQHDHANGALR